MVLLKSRDDISAPRWLNVRLRVMFLILFSALLSMTKGNRINDRLITF